MKSFPKVLDLTKNESENDRKNKIQEIKVKRILCYLRRDIYEHMINNDENTNFNLEGFFKKYNLEKSEEKYMKDVILFELEELGWTCRLMYGGAGLYIYPDASNPPTLCSMCEEI